MRCWTRLTWMDGNESIHHEKTRVSFSNFIFPMLFLNSFFPKSTVGPDSKLKFSGIRTRHTTTLEIFLDQKGLRGREPRRATQCCQPAAKSREGALREHSPGKKGSVLFLALCLVNPAFYLVNLPIGTHAGF